MSEMENREADVDVIGMVHKAQIGKPRPYGVIVPLEDVRRLLELEKLQQKMAMRDAAWFAACIGSMLAGMLAAMLF